MDARLIVEPPAEGSWNMAVDQALLESVDAGAPPAVRVYRWREPTLSLGYFQAQSQRAVHEPSREIACVRRATGGGAIVHDRELTYSVTVPVANRSARHVSDLYCRVHHAIIAFLAAQGVSARRFADSASEPITAGSPFLCFQRRTNDDLVLSGYKVAGSAQRRGRYAVLQHGSILLRTSPCAPELPGVSELSGRTFSNDAASAETLGRMIAEHLQLTVRPTSLDAALRRSAAQIQAGRFANERWLSRR